MDSDICVHVQDEFTPYLRSLYASLTPTETSSNQWPPAYAHEYFRLAMIKEESIQVGQIEDEYVRMTITGKVDDILQKKYPIELQNIFQGSIAKRKRKVVLFEGAPGCGKSTLSVYIAQQVSQGQLFTEFVIAILIRLRDPEIQKAKSIADLLPSRDDEMLQQAANNICANDGRGILFILEGWDELPSEYRHNSIFRQLIQPELSQNPLYESAVIVTSRPIASRDLPKLSHHELKFWDSPLRN